MIDTSWVLMTHHARDASCWCWVLLTPHERAWMLLRHHEDSCCLKWLAGWLPGKLLVRSATNYTHRFSNGIIWKIWGNYNNFRVASISLICNPNVKNDIEVGIRLGRNNPNMIPKWSPNDPNIISTCPRNAHKMIPRWPKNTPKMISKKSHKDPQIIPK